MNGWQHYIIWKQNNEKTTEEDIAGGEAVVYTKASALHSAVHLNVSNCNGFRCRYSGPDTLKVSWLEFTQKLKAVHDSSFALSDIKPSNILLSSLGNTI